MFQYPRKLSQNRLATRLQKRKNPILEHVSLIKYHAYRIAAQLPPNIKITRVINAGILGLMAAVEKHEFSGGVDFKASAEVHIRGSMLDCLRALGWRPNWLGKKRKESTKTSQQSRPEFEREAVDQQLWQAMGIYLDELSKLIIQLKGPSKGSFHEVSTKGEKQVEKSTIYYYPDSISDKPHRIFERRQLKKILAAAVDRLPRNERLVVALHYVEGLTMKEIAAVLGIDKSWACQLYSQAVAELQTKLEQHHPISGAR
jgi:RNA polymerase sigma factor for flagellar operon FliA